MVQSCSIERAVDEALARLPTHIHLGLPLGLGKANRFVNALYQRIKQLPERPKEKATREIAESWRPQRGAAAIFAWHAYSNPAL